MTIADNVIALQAAVAALQTSVNALHSVVAVTAEAPTVDLTPVTTALAAIQAELQPTPAPTTSAV